VQCAGTAGTAEYCNFYDNTVGRAIAYGWYYAFAVRFCVFHGDARGFYLEADSVTIFQIFGCVFSVAEFPTDALFRVDSAGNRFGMATSSLGLPLLPSQDCRSPDAVDLGDFIGAVDSDYAGCSSLLPHDEAYLGLIRLFVVWGDLSGALGFGE
jgi:hypothetical protein